MTLLLRLLLAFATIPIVAADANRLTYLNEASPFWPTASSPKLTTPQWIGESGVDAVVVLAIDDMRDAPGAPGTVKYEAFLRPILERLKRIDGRAPVSVMTCDVAPEDPQLQGWLREGVSLEVHTLTHPCPCLGKASFAEAARVFHGGVDVLASIPNNSPVAFRMPCCDSINSVSPRFYSEIFSRTSEAGHALAIDSSVFTRPPGERFAKYFPTQLRPPVKVTFENYAGFIEDYPYPYVIGWNCWEFPCMVPSDWEAFNLLGPKSPIMLEDWKAALDHVVEAKGVFTAVFHPHGWSAPEQWVEFIEYAEKTYGKRVKFLTFREALARLEKNALAGASLRTAADRGIGARVLDLNHDGFMDVIASTNAKPLTRVWNAATQRWRELNTPDGFPAEAANFSGAAFAVMHKTGTPTIFSFSHPPGAWTFSKDTWQADPTLARDLPPAVRPIFRDFDGNGICEFLADQKVFTWSEADKRWKGADFTLPSDCASTDAMGRDNGLRFADLNGDGFDDVFQSNDSGFAIYLWAGTVRADLGWKRGWPHLVARGHGLPEVTAAKVLPFVKDGQNYGGWFHQGHAVWQNEDTLPLDGYVLRRSFKDLIAFDIPQPKAAEQSLNLLQTKPGFIAEHVASEPLVQDPVSLDWDAKGRLWVVEMRDYPLGLDGKGQPGGVIKVLTDDDADGRLDRATIFAEGLPFPTGVFPWRDGVLVAAAPDILFLADKDGDGRADERRVLFTGFKEGNQQHRMNGFAWGLDGWIYGANGDSGGQIRPGGARGAGLKAIQISGRDFRFRPDTGEFEAEAGNAQFGRYRDDWGNWFGNNNSTWLWHYTLEERYLLRNPRLAVKSTRRMLAQYADATRVFTAYPSDSAPIRFNQPQSLGHVTSASSPAPYRDDLFGAVYGDSVFITEPVHNLVHREVLKGEGASFTSGRAEDEQDREFLASSDPWFRPVMAKTGPDGALYVADMYRFVLEHPEWIAPETRSRLDLRAGADKGRIYRVYPAGAKLRAIPDLSALDTLSLAAAMDHSNGWQRDTVQRLLIERSAKEVALVLKQLVQSAANPKVRVQALATLATLQQIDTDILQVAVKDPHQAVRVFGIRGCESLQATPEVLPTLLACIDDPEFIVRRQLALTLGFFSGDRVASALERLADRDGAREEMRIAILSSVQADSPLFTKLNTPALAAGMNQVTVPKPSSTERAKVAASYSRVGDLDGAPSRGREIFQQQCTICHRFRGEGHDVGPDLAMIHEKPLDWLLTAILDPNAAIEDRYRGQSVRLKTGAELVGIIGAETGNNIVLKLPGGVELPILRSDIADQQTARRSLMPDGMETVLNPQDVADLIAWLRAK